MSGNNSEMGGNDQDFPERTLERPVRKRFENVNDKIPDGPLGAVGGGGIVGFIGYVIAKSGEVITVPIPGIRAPGVKNISHGVEVFDGEELGYGEGDEIERHTIRMAALTEQVAKFNAEYNSAPSNIDFIKAETEVKEVNVLAERPTYSTLEIVVDVAEAGTLENSGSFAEKAQERVKSQDFQDKLRD